MSVVDIVQPLLDSLALEAIAKRTGVTREQAKALCAALADLPIVDVIRITTTCQLDRIRQSEREARKKR